MEKYLFSVFGISIEHPKEWRIFINQRNLFEACDGFVKIEESCVNSKDGRPELSLSLKWELADTDLETFLNRYFEETEKQYKKSLKKENKYKFISKDIVEINDTKGWYIHTKFLANHSIYKALRREEMIETLQLAFFCENSKRIVVTSISTTPEKMADAKSELEKILFSVKCS